MLYCAVQRKNKGGQQFNGVKFSFDFELRGGWASTRLLYEAGKIPKEVKDEFVYICEYDPEDWN